MKKKIISIILIIMLSVPNSILVASAQTYSGHIEETDGRKQNQEKIFTDETKHIESNKYVELTVSQVLAGTTSFEGDEFFAEVSKDVLAQTGVLLPRGTIAHGRIKHIEAPKRMGRDGYIELSFDYLVTPDGREIPIEGGMTSKLNPAKGVTKKVGEDLTATAVGGVYGAVAALELAGIEGAVVSQGYTLLGGAALGGVVALSLALFRKGKDVLIAPGDEIRVKIKSSAPVQVMTHESLRTEEIKYDGLDVRITDVFLEKDPFDNLNTISLDLIIKNNSDYDFSSFDIALVNDLHKSYTPTIFSNYQNSLAMKNIKRGENVSGILSFSVDNPKRQHWLVFYERRTHKPLARISVDNAQKDLNITDLVKNGKKRKKV